MASFFLVKDRKTKFCIPEPPTLDPPPKERIWVSAIGDLDTTTQSDLLPADPVSKSQEQRLRRTLYNYSQSMLGWKVTISCGRTSTGLLKTRLTLECPKTPKIFGVMKEALGGDVFVNVHLQNISCIPTDPGHEVVNVMNIKSQDIQLVATRRGDYVVADNVLNLHAEAFVTAACYGIYNKKGPGENLAYVSLMVFQKLPLPAPYPPLVPTPHQLVAAPHPLLPSSVPRSATEDHRGVSRLMMEAGWACDLTIKCRDGATVRAHRHFLTAMSPRLQAELKDSMNLDWKEKPEEVVNAVLAWMYCGDLTRPTQSCAQALEMLKIGVRFQIFGLENAIRQLMISQPPAWWDWEVAVQLFRDFWEEGREWMTLKRVAVDVVMRNWDVAKESSTWDTIKNNDRAVEHFRQLGGQVEQEGNI